VWRAGPNVLKPHGFGFEHAKPQKPLIESSWTNVPQHEQQCSYTHANAKAFPSLNLIWYQAKLKIF
jgi:hypothetical protein